MKETPTLGKEIWPYGADAGKALRGADKRLKVYNVRNAADRPNKLFSRSGSWFGTAGEEQELSKRYVNSLGEPIDYDENKHDLDEETDVTANYGRKSRVGPDYIRTLTNPNRSTLGTLRHNIGRMTRGGGDPDFAATFHQTNIGKANQFYAQQAEDEQFREATSTPMSRGEVSAYATPADNVRSSSQMPQAPIRNPLSIEAILGYSPYDTLTKGSTLGMNTELDPIKPLDGSSLYGGQGFGMNSNQPAGQLNYAGLASMPRDSEMKTYSREQGQAQSALPWQGAQKSALLGMDPNKMSQSQYMNSRGMPTAAQFDDYLNQSLQDPKSSINAGLANMRAQNQSRMQNTRMNALAESVDPSATTLRMSDSGFATEPKDFDFRQRMASPYHGPADSRSIAQSAREVADNNYADLTRRSLGMDKDLAAKTKTQIDARVNNTLGRLRAASDAIYAPTPINSNTQWGNAGSPSVTKSPLSWNDGSLSSQAPMASRTQTTLNNAVTIGTGSGRRMLTPEEEEIEAQMAKQQMPRQMPRQPVYGGNRITRPNQSTMLNLGIYGNQSSRATSPRPY